jgi:hypothetical protein
MLGNYKVGERLAASQEGLNSVELVRKPETSNNFTRLHGIIFFYRSVYMAMNTWCAF